MKSALLRPFCWLALLGLPSTAAISAEPGRQAPTQLNVRMTKSIAIGYQLFLPKGYEAGAAKRWPLIFFLHGAGERGSDLEKVTVHGPPKIARQNPDLPFIVVSPQCPNGRWWSEDELMQLLDHVSATQAVDTNRIYLTGLSMGGFGTWHLGIEHPDRFAAIAPICGGGEVIGIVIADGARLESLHSLGVWAFHGGKDDVVSREESERMIAALKKKGCTDVKLTIYPDAGHDSWTESYKSPALYEWFLQHDRSAKH